MKIEKPGDGNNVIISGVGPITVRDDNRALATLGFAEYRLNGNMNENRLRANDFMNIKDESLRKFASKFIKTIPESPLPILSQPPVQSQVLPSQEVLSQPMGRNSQEAHYSIGRFESLLESQQSQDYTKKYIRKPSLDCEFDIRKLT